MNTDIQRAQALAILADDLFPVQTWDHDGDTLRTTLAPGITMSLRIVAPFPSAEAVLIGVQTATGSATLYTSIVHLFHLAARPRMLEVLPDLIDGWAAGWAQGATWAPTAVVAEAERMGKSHAYCVAALAGAQEAQETPPRGPLAPPFDPRRMRL